MKKKLLEIVKQFINLSQQQSMRENNSYLLDLLEKFEAKVNQKEFNSTDMARYLYQKINTICLANKIKLTKKELSLLDKIKGISQHGSWLSGLNSFNTTNVWP